jgi:hypothetical protein
MQAQSWVGLVKRVIIAPQALQTISLFLVHREPMEVARALPQLTNAPSAPLGAIAQVVPPLPHCVSQGPMNPIQELDPLVRCVRLAMLAHSLG